MTNATLKTKLAKVVSEIETLTKKVTEAQAKIAEKEAERAKLVEQVESAFDPSTLEANTRVMFDAGKPATSREGIIVGVKDGQAKIAVGSGFDAQLFTVKLDKITSVVKGE